MPSRISVKKFPIVALSTLIPNVVSFCLHGRIEDIVSHLEHVEVDDELPHLAVGHVFTTNDHLGQILVCLFHGSNHWAVNAACGADVKQDLSVYQLLVDLLKFFLFVAWQLKFPAALFSCLHIFVIIFRIRVNGKSFSRSAPSTFFDFLNPVSSLSACRGSSSLFCLFYSLIWNNLIGVVHLKHLSKPILANLIGLIFFLVVVLDRICLFISISLIYRRENRARHLWRRIG